MLYSLEPGDPLVPTGWLAGGGGGGGSGGGGDVCVHTGRGERGVSHTRNNAARTPAVVTPERTMLTHKRNVYGRHSFCQLVSALFVHFGLRLAHVHCLDASPP